MRLEGALEIAEVPGFRYVPCSQIKSRRGRNPECLVALFALTRPAVMGIERLRSHAPAPVEPTIEG
jgi:hypothetical protein